MFIINNIKIKELIKELIEEKFQEVVMQLTDRTFRREYYKDLEKSILNSIEQNIEVSIKDLVNDKSRFNRLIENCVYNLLKHHPELLDKYLINLFNQINDEDKIKNIILERLLSKIN